MKDDDKAVDFGTPELARRFTVVPKLTRGLYGYNGKVVDGSEIDRLLLRDWITVNQHATLEGLLRRLHKASFVGVKSPTYDSPVQADPATVGDRRAHALRSMVKIFRRLDDKAGAEKRKALVDLVLLDVPWNGDKASLQEAVKHLDDAIAGR